MFRKKLRTAETQQPSMAAPSDPFLAAVAEFRAAATKAVAEISAAHKADIASANDTIERARAWVRDSGVGVAAYTLFEKASGWVYWIKERGETLGQLTPLPVTNIETEGSPSDSLSVSFDLAGHHWTFCRIGPRIVFPKALLVKLKVTFDGEDVLLIQLSSPEGSASWKVDEVENLTVGEWAAQLIAMEAELRIHSQQAVADHSAKLRKEHASKIRL